MSNELTEGQGTATDYSAVPSQIIKQIRLGKVEPQKGSTLILCARVVWFRSDADDSSFPFALVHLRDKHFSHLQYTARDRLPSPNIPMPSTMADIRFLFIFYLFIIYTSGVGPFSET